jgi:hypothetical protein
MPERVITRVTINVSERLFVAVDRIGLASTGAGARTGGVAAAT